MHVSVHLIIMSCQFYKFLENLEFLEIVECLSWSLFKPKTCPLSSLDYMEVDENCFVCNISVTFLLQYEWADFGSLSNSST